MSTPRRVVVSGFGIISPIGIGVDAYWSSLAAGRSGLGRVQLMPATAVPGDVVGECREFTEETAKKEYLKPQRKSIKVMCREIELGVASANLAIEQAGLKIDAIDHERLGIEFGANQMFSPPEVLGSGAFACANEANDFQFDQWGDAGLAQMEPLWLLKYLPNMPACHIGIHADARGPNNSLTMAEASSNCVLSEALGIIRLGRADIMLAGTTGSRVHAVKAIHARKWDRLADYGDEDPATWSRPFDRERRGQVIGEGACTLVLETEDHARARGATIYGELLGSGLSCVMDRDGNANCRQAMINAMRIALRNAKLSPADVGHINAHGLASKTMDVDEAAAIHEVFGPHGSTVPVTAIKSSIGNSGAACGNLELTASLLGLKHGVVPHTISFRVADPECPLNVVHGQPLAVSNKVALSINVTAAGQAAAVIIAG